MDGLFVDENTFCEFSALEARRDSQLSQELYAGGFGGFDPVGWMGLLPDPDPVLRKTGDGVDVLRSLLSDDKVISCIQNRKLGTLRKQDYGFKPGAKEGEKPSSASEALCADLAEDLSEINLYNVFSQILDAPYYGYTPVEYMWQPEGGKLRLDDLKPRPVEWFGFNDQHEPYYLGEVDLDIKPALREKAGFAMHFPDAKNPYGLRLLSRCLWPVAIKKGGVQFWTMLCERFGKPWVTALVSGDKTKREEALRMLTAMVTSGVAALSDGSKVDVHTFQGKGEIHKQLVQYCDRCIARALMGQNLTNEGESTGSYAESKTSAGSLEIYQEADEHLLVSFMNGLGKVYRDLNDKAAMAPVFQFREPEDYTAQGELGKQAVDAGARLTDKFFERRMGLKTDEFTVADEKRKGPGTELSSGGDGLSPSQKAVEGLISDLIKSSTSGVAENEKLIIGAILASESADEAMERLLTIYPELSAGDLDEVLSQGLLAASAYGVHTVEQEAKGDE